MSHSGKPLQELGFDSLPDRFRDSLSCETNKPDFKELDLGSPVSPLITRNSAGAHSGGYTGGATVTPSSSSSSSGSVSGKTHNTQLVKKTDGTSNSHSGELCGSTETSPSAAESFRSVAATRNSKPGHRRSSSAGSPLIYSGRSFNCNSNGGSVGGGATSIPSNTTPNSLPSGNICPSGKIMKSTMVCRGSSRTDVLGSGTGNYGHGSIMRGNAKLGGGGTNGDATLTGNIQFAAELGMGKRAAASSDPEEVKKAGNELYRRGNFVEALLLYDRAVSISPDNAAYRSNRAAALTALGRLGEAVRECEEAVRLEPGYGRAHQRLASLYLR